VPSIYHLEGSRDQAFPRFEKPRIPCPTSTFSGFVKQVRPAELSTLERNFLNAALGGFLESAKPAGHVHAMLAALTPHASHEERLPRRYDGDRTLPHGCYYTVCKNAEGDDSGTLSRELVFYKRADLAGGHIEIFDPAIDGQREMIGRLGMDMDARERIVVTFAPFAQPTHATAPFHIKLSIPIEIRELHVENVLDLRRPTALDWVFRTIPNLEIAINQNGDTQPCFPSRKKLTRFTEVLPSLLDQSRGGGNFDKLVGLYLRQIGVSGLVFPSVRNDAYTYAVDDEPMEFHGWTFVDYRNAPTQELVAFFELRPEWPRTLTIEGGDDNEPKAAAFANEFEIHMTENFLSRGGTLLFRGLAQRNKAISIVESLEAAIRFRLPTLSEEDLVKLKVFAVSQGSRATCDFAAMVLYSIQGLELARTNLREFVNKQLNGHPIADMLLKCVNPPPVGDRQLEESAAFKALFHR
jgi:hypothetical protein